jgi:hypothetical protein
MFKFVLTLLTPVIGVITVLHDLRNVVLIGRTSGEVLRWSRAAEKGKGPFPSETGLFIF